MKTNKKLYEVTVYFCNNMNLHYSIKAFDQLEALRELLKFLEYENITKEEEITHIHFEK